MHPSDILFTHKHTSLQPSCYTYSLVSVIAGDYICRSDNGSTDALEQHLNLSIQTNEVGVDQTNIMMLP